MGIASTAKGAGSVVLGLGVLVAMMALAIGLLSGAAAFSIWILKWTIPAFAFILLASIFLVAPLSLIPQTRGYSALGFMIAGVAFGTILWIWGMAYTYSVWGMFGVVVGLVLLGVGVVPVAMFAALLHGDWGNLGLFILTAVLAIGFRALADWLAVKADERATRLEWSRPDPQGELRD